VPNGWGDWQLCRKVSILVDIRMPRLTEAANIGDPHWPPRSPHEALLSTPGGRDRLRRLAERASPSPSPTKRPVSSFRNRAKGLLKADMNMVDGEEEDEETLQLQLQEIQARLKLKKLQKKSKQSSDTENENTRADTGTLSRANSAAAIRAQSRIAGLREERLERSKSQTRIHVPVSPVRKSQPAELPWSPGRVLLGIDKGLKGSDISLKRAPSLRRRDEADAQDRRTGPFLQRASSQAGTRGSRATTPSICLHNEDRPKSFSERMAAVRQQEADREERELRIKKNRSQAFDIDHKQMQTFKETAVDLPDIPRPAPEFSRDEVLNSYNNPTGSGLVRSKTTPNLRSAMRSTSNTSNPISERSDSRASLDIPTNKRATAKSKLPPSEVPESEASQFEPYSSTHLSKRIIPHQVLTRTLSGKKTFLVPDLLREVKSPDFSLPDVEEDIVIFGIIAKKTEPKVHAPSANKKGKYMIMSLTDLKWDVDLFLFDSAFDKFWKLTPGTIIAILNPGIMAPKNAATGKFSLTLNTDTDTVLEIGSARDLGFCKSVKKDGSTCETWVDNRHTEFCDYHVNETLKKTRTNRMEINTMTFGKGDFGKRKFNSKDMTGHFDGQKQREQEKKTRYDRESQSRIYIGGKTSANLLDDVDFDPDAFHRGSTKEERMTRRILAQEKERELARKLAKIGGGLGADYMRKNNTSQQDSSMNNSATDAPPPPEPASLGLLSGKAKDVALSPIKRKRANTASSSAAVGWGSNLSKELGRMKNGENLQPVKKKTRFVTEKGIREAGRESFGGDVVAAKPAPSNDFDDDDDDDLDIVREIEN
jgi:minichromosome maintenance protein 10